MSKKKERKNVEIRGKNSPQKEISIKINDEIKIRDKSFWRELLNLKFLIPTIVSIVAIFIALNIHSPFNLQIYSSGTYIMLGNGSEDALSEPNSMQSMFFITPIEFINKGNKPGVIEDVYFTLRKDEKTVKYFSRYEVDMIKMHEKEHWNALEILNKPFQSFIIQNEGGVSKAILFFSDPTSEGMPPEVGEYIIDIYVNSSGSEEYQNMRSFKITIREDALELLRQNHPVFFRSPKGFSFIIFSPTNSTSN